APYLVKTYVVWLATWHVSLHKRGKRTREATDAHQARRTMYWPAPASTLPDVVGPTPDSRPGESDYTKHRPHYCVVHHRDSSWYRAQSAQLRARHRWDRA